MRSIRLAWTGVAAITVAVTLGRCVQAGNVLSNFNVSDEGWTVTSDVLVAPQVPWTWTPGPSVNQGGWQAWRGNDATGSGTHLVSPCLEVDNVDGSSVRMDIRHRFDFSGTASNPLLALGQVQDSINDGPWQGIRTRGFLATSEKIPPLATNPPTPFPATTNVPAGIALAGIATVVGVGWCARRRRQVVRLAARSFACTAVVAGLVVGLALALAGREARAEPIQTITWDFNVESQATQWTAINTYATSPVPQNPKWTWTAGSGSVPGTWQVDSLGVTSPNSKFGNFLTSQLIQLSPDLPADKFTFNIAHRFRMPTDGLIVNGVQLPVVAGQFEYSLDGASYLPVFKPDWIASGTISPILAPYVQSSTWAVPQFVPGVAPVVSLPPLVDGGASFTGVSQGRNSGWFVASQAFEVDIPGLTTTIQFRFTKMDLATNCGLDAGWDLRFAQVDLILAPEPSSVTIAAAGGVMAAAAMLRYRYQRLSRPSVRP
ncbi:MAG: hypothetical protein K8S94_05460 [Planctomycetia bacterium]|nr:hypothetical protein [Planctomycetia bacterium]